MAVQTREIETPDTPPAAPKDRYAPIERAMGGLLLVAGAIATAWAVPFALHYPMALLVAGAVSAVGIGAVWQKTWAATGMLALGLLLCSASIGYLLVQGPSLLTFAWFFVPGAYLIWVGLRSIAEARRSTAPQAS